MNPLQAKEKQLFEVIESCGRLIVAYSGGVDSACLAFAAHRVLGADALAVTADSPSYPRSHRHMAEEIVRHFGIPHRFVRTKEIDDPRYAANPTDRCYFCKSELFATLESLRSELGFDAVAYGMNSDDTQDFRPGRRAAEEYRVRSPFIEAGLSKREIRALSREYGLPTAGLPASPCLSSRVPYGMQVTPAKLQQIDRAEDSLRELGFRQLRVRHYGDLARVELDPEELPRALDPQVIQRISKLLHELGFRYVTLDLDGYRSGSLNEGLGIEPASSDPSDS